MLQLATLRRLTPAARQELISLSKCLRSLSRCIPRWEEHRRELRSLYDLALALEAIAPGANARRLARFESQKRSLTKLSKSKISFLPYPVRRQGLEPKNSRQERCLMGCLNDLVQAARARSNCCDVQLEGKALVSTFGNNFPACYRPACPGDRRRDSQFYRKPHGRQHAWQDFLP
jgi:hypothetical protein